jgi:hypothetical protein
MLAGQLVSSLRLLGAPREPKPDYECRLARKTSVRVWGRVLRFQETLEQGEAGFEHSRCLEPLQFNHWSGGKVRK